VDLGPLARLMTEKVHDAVLAPFVRALEPGHVR
jgi:hypothetical protein